MDKGEVIKEVFRRGLLCDAVVDARILRVLMPPHQKSLWFSPAHMEWWEDPVFPPHRKNIGLHTAYLYG